MISISKAISKPLVCLGIATGLSTVPTVSAQTEPSQLTARQLYFKPKVEPAKPAPATPSRPAAGRKRTPAPVESAPKVKPEAYLGLRYSIVQPDESGRMVEVDVEKEFHSLERFGLRLLPNADAYLYVVMQGSMGNWDVLFPYQGERNRVMSGKPVTIPPACDPARPRECFQFDEDPGTEKLFIVLSKFPERDLDALIRSVKSDKGQAGATSTTLMAGGLVLPGSDLDRIRGQLQLEARGIRRETVRKSDASPDSENAVYVVNASQAERPRVVADLVLKHR